jgi:DNA modification methylase
MTAPLKILDGRVAIHLGDVLDVLRGMDDSSVDCVVTSPPYWGLRDYGVDGQIGLEPTLAEHLAVMVEVFEEVRRVLKPEGTLWLNYGDCYASTPNGRSAADTKADGKDNRTFRDKPFSTVGPIYQPNENPRGKFVSGGRQMRMESAGRIGAGGYLKPKDLCMIPNRLAIALQDAGWWVRSEIIWAKPNPMPESARDRPAGAHEKIWLLTKSERYFYDSLAVRQKATKTGTPGHLQSGKNSRENIRRTPNAAKVPQGWATGSGAHDTKAHNQPAVSGTEYSDKPTDPGRNLRNWEPAPAEPDVWRIATSPFPEAHFATFPVELAERCIKAGCPKGGVVLDPFGGAGTTALAAVAHGREAILIELNPDYAEIAQARLEKALMGPDERARYGVTAAAPGPLFDTLQKTGETAC